MNKEILIILVFLHWWYFISKTIWNDLTKIKIHKYFHMLSFNHKLIMCLHLFWLSFEIIISLLKPKHDKEMNLQLKSLLPNSKVNDAYGGLKNLTTLFISKYGNKSWLYFWYHGINGLPSIMGHRYIFRNTFKDMGISKIKWTILYLVFLLAK
jgi:hypothetical protein